MSVKTAVLFAGQGAQEVGMGLDLATEYPEVMELYATADEILDFPLSKVSFEGPEAELTKTAVCQPALYVHGLSLLQVLRKEKPGFDFQVAAGLSLGEYTAHAAAGTFDFKSGLHLVHARGKLMQEACEKTQGGMLALIGADVDKAKAVAADADLDVANYNCPGQIVLSGAQEWIPTAVEASKKHGIKRAIPLKVAGAYHSRLMASAQEGLKPYLEKTTLITPRVAVIANVSGESVESPAAIRETLATQVCGSVRWEDSVRKMIALGVQRFIELGPGGVLAGFLKKIDPSLPCISIGTLKDWKEKGHAIGE